MTKAIINDILKEIEDGHLLPTRGNIHDLSGAITHKREIITLYLEGNLTHKIVAMTNHSKEAVDRYIKDCHRVETLWEHGITDLHDISNLSRLSKRVVVQYIDLLPEKIKKFIGKDKFANPDKTSNMSIADETETGSAGEQPDRDNQQ